MLPAPKSQQRTPPSHLVGMCAGTWFRVLKENGYAVDGAFLGSAATVTAMSLVNSFCRMIEDDGEGDDGTPVPDPLFIIGHWRSGTTLLHNLLDTDTRFATPEFCQAFFPNSFLTAGRPLRFILERTLPKKRVIDDMEFGPGLPQEDEFALCALTGLSPYVAYAFPKNWQHYNRYLTFENVPEEETRRWQKAMKAYVRKLTRHYGRAMVLKSPPHTARLKILLEIFPNAKFVHVHRNPFDVFQSSCRTLALGPPLLKMQHFDFSHLEELILGRYEMLYDMYLAQRALVPHGHLYEMSYAALSRDPVGEVERLYAALDLPEFAEGAAPLRAYVATLQGYRPNRHEVLEGGTAEKVVTRWRRFFSNWGYPTDPLGAAK